METGLSLTLAVVIARAVVLLLAMTVHEYAHARVAYEMGDTTAHDMGRMTLDPRANINWGGFIIGVLIGFGILGSAPVNRYRMRDPRWGNFFAVFAGPVSNLLLAIPFAIPYWFGRAPGFFYTLGDDQFIPTPNTFFEQMMLLNVVLFVFNLLPLYPLDGWTIVREALPTGASVWWQRNQKISMYILIGLVLLTFVGDRFNLLGLIIYGPTFFIIRLITLNF